MKHGYRPHSKLGWRTPVDFANTFHPRRDLALSYAEASAPDPDASINVKPHSNPQSELRIGYK